MKISRIEGNPDHELAPRGGAKRMVGYAPQLPIQLGRPLTNPAKRPHIVLRETFPIRAHKLIG